MNRNALAITAVIASIAWGMSGCSSSTGPSALAIDTDAAVTRGQEAIESEDWEAAETELTAAIDAGVLSGDKYEETVFARARARLENDNLEGAEEDLSQLEEGAAAMDQVLALKAHLLLKQGDELLAKKVLAKARKINRNVITPKGL
jgi:uncharacterized protein HemY